MSDAVENMKMALVATKLAGKFEGIVLSMRVIEKLNREYSQDNVAASSDHVLGATYQAMVISKTLKDLGDELRKEIELLPEIKGEN